MPIAPEHHDDPPNREPHSTNLLFIRDDLWVRAGAELSHEEELRVAWFHTESQPPPTEEQHARWAALREARDTRRALFTGERGEQAGHAGLAIDDLATIFEHLVQLQIECEARVAAAMGLVEGAISELRYVAPRGNHYYDGGSWLDEDAYDPDLGTVGLKRHLRGEVDRRKAELLQEEEDATIAWAERQKAPRHEGMFPS